MEKNIQKKKYCHLKKMKKKKKEEEEGNQRQEKNPILKEQILKMMK